MTMKTARRSIFRDEAIHRYVESREKSILPRLVSPHTFLYLWLLLGLLVVSGFVAWFTRIPVYASGSAVVVRWRSKPQMAREAIVVAAFFPPQTRSSLQVSQKLSLRFEALGERFSSSIIAVEPEISSPAAARKQFGLDAGAALAITQPVAVAIAEFKPLSKGLPAPQYLGSVGRAEAEVGSRRAISLLPLIRDLE
jgi:hypothetical protein